MHSFFMGVWFRSVVINGPAPCRVFNLVDRSALAENPPLKPESKPAPSAHRHFPKHMKSRLALLVCLAACAITACDDRSKPIPAIPEKKSRFQKTVFTQPQVGSTITLVSETECEIGTGGQILLAEYSRQEDKLRVVMLAGGAASVSYFDVFPDGLLAPDGHVFLLPQPLNKYYEEREAEEARERAAKIEQGNVRRQREMELEKAFAELGHTFNANGYCTRCGWEREFVKKTSRPCQK